jgi:hypothetical protein
MRLKSLGLALAMSGLMTAAAGAQIALQTGDHDLVPTGKGWGVPNPGLEKRKPKPPAPPPPATNGINYHNGPVMLGTINLYYIWYGDWNGNSAVDILTAEAESIGGTPWFNINTTYWDKTNKRVSNSVAFKGSTTDDYSHGKALSDDDVFEVVTDAISSGRLPKDANGIYFVLTSADVDETSGFCSHYCGWHYFGDFARTTLKFSFVGNSDRCPNVCTRLRFRSPNDNIGADGMASVIAHELSEAATDPLLTAWYDKGGQENADKCAFTYGDIYSTPNGAAANVQWGGRDFLIQRNWVNAGGGSCATGYP